MQYQQSHMVSLTKSQIPRSVTMTTPADRIFYSVPRNDTHNTNSTRTNKEKLLKYIRDNVIGCDKVFSGPFGLRKVTYLDYIASGRSLEFLEDYIRREVLPEYGNTHTTTSITSLQTTLFRHEARDIIRNSVNASEHDSVIFVGSGCTAAVHKLIHALDLQTAPVVFLGPCEHHSNLLPWLEVASQVVRIGLTSEGKMDLLHLESELKTWQSKGRQLIGCFTAASNITGILMDVNAVTILLHRHGALAFWDYATAAPYVDIDMNPVISGADQPYVYKDAIYFSPHKFVGGVSTPGVLIAKKKLFKNVIPDKCGGGSVFFVRRESHRYLQEPELKEEGGTPAIVETIRAGMVFQLKDAVSSTTIMQLEHQLSSRAFAAWRDIRELVLLGPADQPRLPIFSFLVHHPASNRFLHHNFVAALLNDVFGIQARGGCACAGPYAMDVLGLNEETAVQIENLLLEDKRLDRAHLRRYQEYSPREILRPGFVRLNLPYFLDEACLAFVLEAIRLVAKEGWKMLPQYMFNPETGEWRQKNFQVFKERKWLSLISYQSGEMSYREPVPGVKGPLPADYQECLQMAQRLFQQASKKQMRLPDQSLMFDVEAEKMRWFLLPSEAEARLHGNNSSALPLESMPFCPPSLRCLLLGELAPSDRESPTVKSSLLPTSGDVTPQVVSPSITDAPQEAENWERATGSNCSADNDNVTASTELPGSCGEHLSNDGEQLEISSSLHVQKFLSPWNCCDNDPVPSQTSDVVFVPGPRDTDGKATNKASVESDEFQRHTASSEDTSKSEISADMARCRSNLSVSNTPHLSSLDAISGCPAREPEPFPSGMVKALQEGYSDACPNFSLSDVCSVVHIGSSRCSEVSASCATSPGLPSGTNHGVPKQGTAETNSRRSGSCSSLQDSPVEVDRTHVVGDSTEVDTAYRTVSDADADGANKAPFTCLKPRPAGGPGALRQTKNSVMNRLECPPCPPQASSASSSSASSQWKWFSPPKSIFKPTVQAMEDFAMLQDGDRVLVCLSGGKDSLSLLHTMHQLQFYCKGKGVTFELGAVTVDPQTAAYDPSPLRTYLASLGVPYFYESQSILETASSLPYECASICSFCSRMKRGRIYAAARREGYNVLALGQHLDDLSESLLMSLFHNGSLRTMKAHYRVQKNDLRVIRPFVYVREKDLRNFAEKNKLPVIAENCPACFEAPKERHRTKQLLAGQELLFPRLYSSLMAAMKPLMAINRTHVNVRSILTWAGGLDSEEGGGEELR